MDVSGCVPRQAWGGADHRIEKYRCLEVLSWAYDVRLPKLSGLFVPLGTICPQSAVAAQNSLGCRIRGTLVSPVSTVTVRPVRRGVVLRSAGRACVRT